MNRFMRWVSSPLHATWWGQFLWGACAAWGMPSSSFAPCFFVGFFMHRYALDPLTSWSEAFKKSWCFHLAFLGISLHWIVTCLSQDWEKFWWFSPFIALGLPLFLSSYHALGAAAASRIRAQGLARVWFAALWYSLAEWARGHMFTGMPWHLYGYALTEHHPWAQSVSFFGVYGLTFTIIFLVFLVVAWARDRQVSSLQTGVIGGLIIAFLFSISLYHYHRPQWAPHPSPLKLRIVQPNIPQHLKWSTQRAAHHLKRLEELSQGSSDTVDILIWPETAMPYAIPTHASHIPPLESVWKQARFLALGAIERKDASDAVPHHTIFYNSLLWVNADHQILGRYRKKHLVPFGEFIPLRGFLPMPSIASSFADYHAGPGPVTLGSPEVPPFSPLVCYDVIFSGDVTQVGPTGPQWILNITNDAWFAWGWGPQQHLHLACVRAIEEGLPLVRAANTGVSAIIDAHGTLVHALPFNTQGTLEGILPDPLRPTLFRTYGNLAAWIWFLGLGIFSWAIHRLTRHTTQGGLERAKKP